MAADCMAKGEKRVVVAAEMKVTMAMRVVALVVASLTLRFERSYQSNSHTDVLHHMH